MADAAVVSWARRAGAALFVAVAVLGITPRLGSQVERVGPGWVAINFAPAMSGRTVLALPPVGTASAPTHRAPVQLRLELRSLDVSALLGDGGRVDAPRLEASIRNDIQTAVVRAAGRLVLLSVLVGAVAAAVLPRRRFLTILVGAFGGAVLSGLLVASTLPGFDASRFDELTYRGPVTEGSKLLRQLTSETSAVGRRVDALAGKLAGLYSASVTDQLADDDEVLILHISDLHLNPIGAQLARRLAESFGVDAVLDTGDTTSFGTSFEGPYAEMLADFPVPYLFVAGNHDSVPNREAIKATPGVVPLNQTSVEIEGLVIAGFDDPVITTVDDVPRAERERRQEEAAPRLRRLIQRTEPDVVAVHNPVILKQLMGEMPLAVGGHQHQYRFGARNGTLAVLAGSTGATGLGSLLVDADVPASANLLHFREGKLTAVDRLDVIGTSGDLQVQRHTVTEEDREADDAPFIRRDVDEAREAPPEEPGEDESPDQEPESSTSTTTTTTTTP
ncbi:MAG: metallophosphoesterase [Microthrixaceae bacterium]|nr:metallophosphoesterase [Microthrixaceae bacterium]